MKEMKLKRHLGAKEILLSGSGCAMMKQMILGEMVNLQKVNLPKKVNSLKTPNIAFWLFYTHVDFLVS
jgi:hypothetical protein